MIFGSVCSGIEAASIAWGHLGWRPAFFAENDKFPSAVLAHHHPDVPNHGDMNTYAEWPEHAIDVLVGGTPCQSFSVAGLRAGLDDPRGSLMLVYGAIARRYRPRWVVWENVPGVLSDDSGHSFASLLALLSGQQIEIPSKGWRTAGVVPGIESAYGLAWRVLDAQFVRIHGFGRAVPQRRRRVFVVGYLGDWRRAAAVLFERESLCGNPAPCREAGQKAANTLSVRSGGGGHPDGGDGRHDHLIAQITAPTLDANYGKLQGASGQDLNHGHGHLVAFGGNNTEGEIDVATACRAKGGSGHGDFESETFVAQAFKGRRHASHWNGGPHPPLSQGSQTRSGSIGASNQELFEQGGAGLVLDTMEAHGVAVGGLRRMGSPQGGEGPTLGDVAPALENNHHGQSGVIVPFDETQITHPENRSKPKPGDPAPALAKGARPPTLAFSVKDYGNDVMDDLEAKETDISAALSARQNSDTRDRGTHIVSSWRVRRLTPRECERLQGFPDDFTLIPYRGKPAADGPRYKALGNSFAVNVVRWIGQRIQMVEDMEKDK